MELCKTVFYAHKKLYYNRRSDSWSSGPSIRSTLVEEGEATFEFDHNSEGKEICVSVIDTESKGSKIYRNPGCCNPSGTISSWVGHFCNSCRT